MALVSQKEPFQAVYPTGLVMPHGAVGWHRSAFDTDIDAALEQVCEDGGWVAHLAADDTIECVSAGAGDTTQTLYVRGIDTNNKVRIESFAIAGVAPVLSAVKFRYVECAWLDAECANNITVRRTTGPANILVITAGQLQSYCVHHFNGEFTSYITGLYMGAGGTMTDSVNLELRHYPDDLDSRDLGDGYLKLIEPTIHVFQGAVGSSVGGARMANPPPFVFPQPIRIPAGSYITLYGIGEAANQDVWAFMQGFDVIEE